MGERAPAGTRPACMVGSRPLGQARTTRPAGPRPVSVMLKRLLGFFRSDPIRIEGSSKLSEGKAHKISIGDPVAGTGRDVLLVRLDGEVHAIDNQCPHAGAFIADGELVEGKFLVCPLHNYRFDPKTGACVNASCRKARRYKTVEKDGTLEVYV